MTTLNEPADVVLKRGKQPPAEIIRLLVFHVADCAYALPVTDVSEIISLAEVTRPPVCPPFLRGFVNISGTPLPVISVRGLFDLSEVPCGRYSPLLLLRADKRRLALLVDRVSRIVAVSTGSVAPLSADHSLNNCVTGILRLEGSNVLLLSAARILLEEEHASLAALEEAEQGRLRSLEAATP